MKALSVVCLVLLTFALSEGRRIPKELSAPVKIPAGWKNLGPADPNARVKLTIAIKQRNTDLLERKLMEVSNPSHPQYGKYLSLEQLAELISPTQENKKLVEDWVKSYQITDYRFTTIQDFLILNTTVAVAEQMLGIQYFTFEHSNPSMKLIRSTGPYYIPSELDEAIDFIGGIFRFPKMSALTVKQSSTQKRQTVNVTPSVIKKVFGIPADTQGENSKNSQAVAQFLKQYMSFSDLSAFQAANNLPIQNVTKLIGPNVASDPGLEANLDIQYIMGVAPKVSTWFVSTGGEHEGQEPFLEWIVNQINTPDTPWVHSISYGDDENSLTVDYMDRINDEFKKFGTLGRSLLFASGDSGVGCNQQCSLFVPGFPASSPFVTAVGGFVLSGDVNNPTLTADTISSGGFSNIFGRPSYQVDAVNSYLQATHSCQARSLTSSQNQGSNLPPQSFWNATGRAMPDIAAFSENVVIYYYGSAAPIGGTSCAAPVVSAVVSLLNDQRFKAGKNALGFLNPFLYQLYASHPDAFIDVTTGSNPQGCCPGFQAAKGWDPITGVGAPNFPTLLKYALQV